MLNYSYLERAVVTNKNFFCLSGSLHSASPMSGKSSVSMEDNVLSGAACPMAVKVHTDFVPGKTDTDFLKLEVDI